MAHPTHPPNTELSYSKRQADDHGRAATLVSKEFKWKAEDPALLQHPDGATGMLIRQSKGTPACTTDRKYSRRPTGEP